MVTTLVIWVLLFPFFGATNSHGISPQLIMLALGLRNTRNATSFLVKKLFWCWAALFWSVSFQLSFNMLCRKELMVRKQMKHFSYLSYSSGINLPTSHNDLAWKDQMCYLLSFDTKYNIYKKKSKSKQISKIMSNPVHLCHVGVQVMKP